MSYCRFWWDDSDVYVYESDRGIECCGCKLPEYARGYTADDPEEMIAHLLLHRERGHTVPEYALETLREEAGLPLAFPEKTALEYARENADWAERSGTEGAKLIARITLEHLEGGAS